MPYKYPIIGEPTDTFILIAVKAMLRNETPAKAILAVIADLEALGEEERKAAEQHEQQHEQLLNSVYQFQKADP